MIDLESRLLPDFLSVTQSLIQMLGTNEFYGHLSATLVRLIPGLLVSLLIGVPTGLALAQFTVCQKVFEPVLTLARGVPVASLFPVAILLFGVGESARAALVFYVAFPILATATLSGAAERAENRTRRDYLRIHGERLPWFDYPMCLLWDALPSIVGGVRIALGISLVVIIVSEMFFVGGSGIGWYTWDQYQSFNFANMYAAILAIGICSILLDLVIGRLIRARN